MGRVLINDTTLRDGEQSLRRGLSGQRKIAIAEALYAAGIEAMEVGTPAMGEEECARIRQVRRQLPGATLMTWCRMQAGEIRQSADLGMDWVDISIPASDKLRQYKLREGLPLLLERLAALIHLAHTLGLKVCIGCEDASRASDATLQDIAHLAREAGATRLRYADTVGILDPFTTAAQIAALRRVWPGELEMHAHNDLGLATANTRRRCAPGATSVNTTVLGLGERAGNAALETVALGLERCLEVKTGVRFTALPALCEQVASPPAARWIPSSRWWVSWSLPTNPACTLRRCCATARAIRRSTPPCWAAAIGWCWANTPVARRLTASSIGWVIT